MLLPADRLPARAAAARRLFFFFLSFFLFKHVRADEGKAKAAQKPKAGRARFPPGGSELAGTTAPPTIPHAGHQRGRDGRGALESPNGIRARAKGGAVLAFRGRAGSAAKQHAGLRLVVVEPGGDLPVSYCTTLLHIFFLTVTMQARAAPVSNSPAGQQLSLEIKRVFSF